MNNSKTPQVNNNLKMSNENIKIPSIPNVINILKQIQMQNRNQKKDCDSLLKENKELKKTIKKKDKDLVASRKGREDDKKKNEFCIKNIKSAYQGGVEMDKKKMEKFKKAHIHNLVKDLPLEELVKLMAYTSRLISKFSYTKKKEEKKTTKDWKCINTEDYQDINLKWKETDYNNELRSCDGNSEQSPGNKKFCVKCHSRWKRIRGNLIKEHPEIKLKKTHQVYGAEYNVKMLSRDDINTDVVGEETV